MNEVMIVDNVWIQQQIDQETATLRAEIDNLRAELAAANDRYDTLQAAAIDYWNVSYVRSPAGEAASDALLALFHADAVTHTLDLEGGV